MTNIHSPRFEEGERPQGFGARRARIGYELGTERIGCSLFEVPAGQAAYPYHFHYADEELLIVLEGRPTLRTPGGERELEQGEAVCFAVGEEGAHQLINRAISRSPSSRSPATAGRTSSTTRTPTRSVSASACHTAAGCEPSSAVGTRSATGPVSTHRHDITIARPVHPRVPRHDGRPLPVPGEDRSVRPVTQQR
ncbi:MAG TPA: cupin domain-containing protein [Solirubrobacteraceae bacterium]|nr:cupin domain-containing protein [Solirubrobacteraceae bacterium]